MRAIVLIAVTACGRVEFAPLADATATATDIDSPAQVATCPPGALLCDLLDGPAIDGSIWNVRSGTLTFDTTIRHRGAASLDVQVGPGPAGVEFGSYLGHTGTFVLTEPELWIRAWVRLSDLPQSTNGLEIMAVEQNGASGNSMFVRSDDTQVFHQFDDMQNGAGSAAPVGAWFCLVWHLTLAQSGSSDVTSDVLPPFTLAGQTQGAPPVDLLAFEAYFAAPNVAVDQPELHVWFDDLLVDNAPVSCAD